MLDAERQLKVLEQTFHVNLENQQKQTQKDAERAARRELRHAKAALLKLQQERAQDWVSMSNVRPTTSATTELEVSFTSIPKCTKERGNTIITTTRSTKSRDQSVQIKPAILPVCPFDREYV